MRYKKLLYFLIFLIFSFTYVSLISAASCSDSQTIMKLYSATNSHGAIWSYSGYSVRICYDTIFRLPYNGASPQNCASGNSNLVLKLSATTNAHAQRPEYSTYTQNVCYGNLVCVMRANSCDTTQNEKVVVSLLADSNSHIAEGDYAPYPRKICCKIAIVTPPNDITNLYFSDMSFNLVPINQADLNDQVKLVVRGNNLYHKNIQFKIYQDTNLGSGVTKGSEITSTTTPVIVSGQANDYAFYVWRPNAAGQYIFEASSAGGAWVQSWTNIVVGSVLTVTAPEDNSNPIANIIAPTNGETYSKGQTIEFKQSSYDIDDIIDYTWDFGDGTTLSGDTETMANYDTTHPYLTAGTKTINLMVTDKRGKTAFDSVSISVLDAGYSNICIDKNTWFDDSGQGHDTSLTTNVNYCKGTDNIIGNEDDCCPAGYKCQDNPGDRSQRVCVLDSINTCDITITRCEDLTTKIDCEQDTCFKKSPVALGGSEFSCAGIQFISKTVINEKCAWKNEECKLDVTKTTSGGSGNTKYEHTCNEIQTSEGCVDGKRSVSIDRTIIWDPLFIRDIESQNPGHTFDDFIKNDPECQYMINSCLDESKLVICGDNLVKLPFFGFIQFIISLAIITIIYIFIIFKNQKNSIFVWSF